MKDEKNSPGKLKQPKITAFLLNVVNATSRNETVMVKGKRRRNDEESHDLYRTPKKVAKCLNSETPEIIFSSTETFKENTSWKGPFENRVKDNKTKDSLENFAFEDFENDPFLSPKKETSPKKRILSPTNDNSQNQNCSPLVEDEKWESQKSELTFHIPLKCKVIRSTISTKGRVEQILLVANEKSDKKGICKLRDVWTFSSLSVGDVVTIQADESEDGWVVDNKVGYVVLNPDIIISSTSLVCSMFCMRQEIFSSLYKGIDSGSNTKMLIGRLIHELLQECMKTRSCSDENLSKITGNFLKSRELLRDLYFNDMKFSDIQKEINAFVPRIKNFIDVYLNKEVAPSGKNFHGTIEDVLDIEELIRSPNLGIQGRVDVTVRLKSDKAEGIAPLELKTGRASFSNEHKSQLILYILLMNELGRKVESGLLLYLKEDIMEEIMPQRDEIRNLFLLRNQLVRFYGNMGPNNLPEPIHNTRACLKCPYVKVCSSYLKGEGTINYSLACIEIPGVTESHVDYFRKWNTMLWLEYGECFNKAASEYEISGLKLELNVENFKGEFRHNFRKTSDGGKALLPGTFVWIMDGKNNRIASGKIVDITGSAYSVLLDKNLENFSDVYKIIGFKSKFLSFYLTNLGLLLEEKFEFLRQIIIDKRLPTFQEKLDKKAFVEKCLKNMLDLNKEQQKAILKSILCNDYLLIKGPPGTGKTQTIVTLIRTLLALGQNILIASHTHSSVDNILLRLQDVEYLRLGALKNVHKKIHRNCYEKLFENCSNVDDVKKLFDRMVFASTCSGIDTDFVFKKKFDVCIIDESSQVLQPEILRPLLCCKKFILVGDEDQLPPIVQNSEAKKLGMAKSMFEWLTNESATICLKFQYRMNSVINSLANAIAYNGFIECANEEVAKRTIRIQNYEKYSRSDEWITDVLSSDLEKSVVFVDTSNYFTRGEKELPEKQRSSLLEANIVVTLISSLVEFGLTENSVGVITPFCDQIVLLKKKLWEKKLENVEINTVDQFQGRDKDVIFFSCAKENQKSREATEGELLKDKRRLTVAVTRAKYKLVVIGDRLTVGKYEPFRALIEFLKDSQFFHLSDGQKNFFWDKFLA